MEFSFLITSCRLEILMEMLSQHSMFVYVSGCGGYRVLGMLEVEGS